MDIEKIEDNNKEPQIQLAQQNIIDNKNNYEFRQNISIKYDYQDKEAIEQHNSLCKKIKLIMVMFLFLFLYYTAHISKTPFLSLNKHKLQKTKIWNYEYTNKKQNIINLKDKYQKKFKNKNITQILKKQKYYDFQYFLRSNQNELDYEIILQQKQLFIKKKFRPLINFSKPIQQLNKQINAIHEREKQIKHNSKSKSDKMNISNRNLDYYYQLYFNQGHDSSQIQFFKLDKQYGIGNFRNQLPLCIVIAGRNKIQKILKSYNSISRQNYTNYRIIHVDDHSSDFTVNRTLEYLQQKQQLKNRVTLIVNKYHKNMLFSKNLGVSKFCKEGQIVVELNAGNQFIGNQVFQLINTIYQKQNRVNDKNQQVWLAYFSTLSQTNQCCSTSKIHPALYIKEKLQIKNINYLPTYRWEIYEKINKNQLIDYSIPNRKQFYAKYQDAFIQKAMLQISGLKHLLVIDQFTHFSSEILEHNQDLYGEYTMLAATKLYCYQQLQKITDKPKRNFHSKISNQKQRIFRQKLNQIQLKLTKISELIKQQYLSQMEKLSIVQELFVYNKENEGKNFVQQPYFQIDLSSFVFSNTIKAFNYKNNGFQTNIQAASMYDYVPLNKLVDYQILKQKMNTILAHQTYQFKFNSDFQYQIPQLQYKIFYDQKQIQFQIHKIKNSKPNNNNYLQEYLGLGLSNSINQKYIQLQYYYAKKKYNIDQNNKQRSFCIFSYGTNMYSKGSFIKYFQNIQYLNYTNFHIVYVDDYSDDQSAIKIYKYLLQNNFKIRNKIKIVRNLQYVGKQGSIHIHLLKYCKPNEIVLIMDMDDIILGRQVLKIYNRKFKNPDTWVVYSQFLVSSQVNNFAFKSQTQHPITLNLQQYRYQFQYWVTQNSIAFRWQICNLIPLQHIIQFKYNNINKKAFPSYYQLSDRCFIYSSLQMSGRNKIRFLTDYLFVKKEANMNKCKAIQKQYEQYKCRIKYSIKPIQYFNRSIQFKFKNQFTNTLLQGISKSYRNYKECEDHKLSSF